MTEARSPSLQRRACAASNPLGPVRVLAGLMAGAWFALGCAGNAVVVEELPGEPIAFIYRTLEEGRARAEALGAKREASGNVPIGAGMMNLNDADEYLATITGNTRRVPSRHDGRVALLYPRTGKVEVLEALLPGAIPQAWNEPRTKMLFASRRSGGFQLYEYRLPDGLLGRVVSGHSQQPQGVYGPDDRVAYTEMRGGRNADPSLSIWVTTGAGRPEPVTAGPADAGPVWSRDGRWLLFENTGPRGERRIMALDRSKEGAEPRIVARGADPVISPRGDWVVYSRETRAGWRLWRMRPDGSGKSALGVRNQGEADERAPTISPDGRYVAYVADKDLRQRLRVRRIDGTGDRPLFEDGDGSLPAW